MFDIQKIMKQAQQMQEKMQGIQKELEATELVGKAGGGAIEIKANAKLQFSGVTISPDAAAGDAGMLEDLMLTALQDLTRQSEQITEEKMKSVTGGVNIPGIKLPF